MTAKPTVFAPHAFTRFCRALRRNGTCGFNGVESIYPRAAIGAVANRVAAK